MSLWVIASLEIFSLDLQMQSDDRIAIPLRKYTRHAENKVNKVSL